MAIGFILLNVALMAGVVLVVAGGIFWAIATQHRDHGALSTGPLLRRRVWSERRRRPRTTVAYRPHPAR